MAENNIQPSVKATVNVHLWGNLVGQVLEYSNGRIGFIYNRQFCGTGRPLSPKNLPLGPGIIEFPELKNSEAFQGLPGVLADSLPDLFGNKIIKRYFNARGEKEKYLSPVQKLLYVGKRSMGALEYMPTLQHKTPEDEKSIELQSLVDSAHLLSEGDTSEAVQQIMRLSGTIGGARAKAPILWNRKNGHIRSGFANPKKEDEAWIIKLSGIDTATAEDHANTFNRIEYTYALTAKKLNIDIPEVAFLEEKGRFHYMTKRFDRNTDEKVHIHSLGGLTHVDYNKPQSYSYEAWFRLMYELNLGQGAIEQGFRRMVFNIVGRNQNDHVKNISFMLHSIAGEWRLAPAYDLTFAAGMGSTAKHQMTLGGKADNFDRALLLETGKKFDVKHPAAVVDEVVHLFSEWGGLAEKYGVRKTRITEIQKKHRLF